MKIKPGQIETFIKNLQERLKSKLDQETKRDWFIVPEWVRWDLRFKCYPALRERGIATEFYDIETVTFNDIEQLAEQGKNVILSFYEKQVTADEQH